MCIVAFLKYPLCFMSLGLVALVTPACEKLTPDKETLVALSLADPDPPPPPVVPPPPPPPPRWTVDLVIDTASSAASKSAVGETVAAAVDFIGEQDPTSELRIWVLDSADAQLVNQRSTNVNGWVQAVDGANPAHRSGEATLRIERLMTALAAIPPAAASPVAEGLTKVGLSAPADRQHWLVILLTDGIQERNTCPAPWDRPSPCQPRFNCTPPSKIEWLKFLDDQRLLPEGALNGADVVFGFFEPAPQQICCGDGRCLASMAYVQALQELWRAALVERAGARVTFSLRAAKLPAAAQATASKPVAKKEAQ